MNSLYRGEKRRLRAGSIAAIRRKIRNGFIILGCLLLFSGMVSWFELGRLNRTTGTLMEVSVRDLELSQAMFDAIERQRNALEADVANVDSLFLIGQAEFERAFREAERLKIYPRRLARIAESKKRYDSVSGNTLTHTDLEYLLVWHRLALDIKDFMIDSQNTVDRNTSQVQANAYRALVPGIITLIIAIAIVVIFYFMIDLYYVGPMIRVSRALDNYLNLKVPYNVKLEGRDEVKALSEQIETLVSLLGKKENNP